MPLNILIEALDEQGGHRWRIRAIRAGLSGNGNFYPDKVLREAVALFDGARVFVKPDDVHLKGNGRGFRNLIGRLSEPRFVEGQAPDTGEIQATLEVLDSADGIASRLREAWDRDMGDLFGFSIDALGATKPGQMNGRRTRVATKLVEVKSVDLIVEPGAGGQVIQLIEAQAPVQEDPDMTIREKMLETIETKRPDLHKKLDLENPDEDAIIDAYRESLAKDAEGGQVTGLGDVSRVELVEGRPERVGQMLDALFDPAERSVRSIRECYIDVTGDRQFTGLYRNCDMARLRESLDSASFPEVLGDSIARRMIKEYGVETPFDVWRDVATTVPVQDFRTQERVRFGGYGDLPEVAEKAPYNALTSPTDEKATYAITKKGGTEDVTLEMIANDDVGAIQRIPRKLARAAKRTLSKFVLDFIKDNPTIYDGKAFFHADHNNLGSSALDANTLAAARIAMKQQTERDSGERLGIGPRFLWVPDELEETGYNLFRRDTNNDDDFIQSLSLRIRPVWYWDDTNDWAITADTADVPIIEVGFFQGQEEPELFIQDSPTLGSMFSNDTTTYKIRHIYGGAVTDYRGAYKGVVA